MITNGIWCVVNNLWPCDWQNVVFFSIRSPKKIMETLKFGQGPVSVTNSFFFLYNVHLYIICNI